MRLIDADALERDGWVLQRVIKENKSMTILVKKPTDFPIIELDLIRCKDCEYGEQDEDGRWFCMFFYCQVGDADGSGFCADAERREDG